MQEISFEVLNEYLSYDPESGEIRWKKKSGPRSIVGSIAGNVYDNGQNIYIRIKIKKKLMPAHRIAWCLMHKDYPDNDIDHINGNGIDNRSLNLRSVTRKENARNQKLRSTNKSGFQGVHWCRYKWQAQIRHGDGHVYLGVFEKLEDAIEARKAANIKYGYHENHGALR